MLRTFFRILLVLVVALATSRSPARAGPAGDGMDFGPAPQSGSTPGRKPGGSDAPATAQPADDPVAKEIAALSDWPRRLGTRAAESLLLRGAEVIPYLVGVLDGPESSAQPGAAWVLGRLGEPAHIQILLRAAARRRNGSRAESFFQAAYDLDGRRTKTWLFSFLTLKRPVFRQKATRFLAAHIGTEDRERVIRLLDSDREGVRISGLRLLEPGRVEDAEARLVQALSDPSPDVCKAAAVLLALRKDEALLRRLNVLAVNGRVRERAYAILTLVEVARTRDVNPFEPATLRAMAGRRGLLHPERLSRGAAAVGLAFGALDSADAGLQTLLDRTVVDVLIDTVGGGHFRDFPSLAELVFSALRRLSGLDLPATATAWAKWWRDERGRFQARRPLGAFTEDDLPLAYVGVRIVGAEGRHRQATFRPEGSAAADGDFILRRDVFLAWVGALDSAGIFETSVREPVRADEHLVILLGVGNQRRELVIPASDERYPLLSMRVESLLEANQWQRYRDVDRWPDVQAWWKTNVKLMEDADPETRRVLLRSAVVHSFDDLPTDAARAAALDLLEDLMREDEKVGGLSGPEVRDLVQAATHAVAFGGVEERAVRLAMLQKTSAKVRKDLVESLAARSEPAAAVVLADLLVSGGLPAVREAIADARPAMRVAAARAARRLIEEAGAANAAALKRTADALRPGLEVIARDDVPDVAIRAAVALHALGEPKALDRLEAIYKAGNTGVKVAVAAALGDVKADDAYPLLNLMLANERGRESGVLRAAALQALGRTKHVNAVNLLIFYLLNDADPGVQHAAANALIDLGSDGSRLAVIRALTEGHPDPARRASLVAILGHFPGGAVRDVLQSYLEDKDAPVARAAALALAAQNVAASVPYLIEMARSGNAAEGEDAIRALENVSLVRFRSRGHKVIAEEYEAWYRTARITAAREPDRAWLRDALHKQGYDVGPLTLYVAGQPDPTSVPLLIRALRDEDPLIRRGAAIALGRITGLSFGEVGRATSLRDASRVADAWSRWWSRVKGPPDR